MKAAPTAAFQNLSTLCIQSFLRNLNHRRKPKRRSRSRTIDGACHVRKIDYPGSNNRTEFTFGPNSGRVKIVEITSGSVTSTKQFVAGVEERDGSGALVSQFFALGQRTSGSNYFYRKSGACDSVAGLSDNSGNEITTINYSPYGNRVKTNGTFIPDYGYASYFLHQRSGLNLTVFRAYDPRIGRWISRDPIGESGGRNLYAYVENSPIDHTDPEGLQAGFHYGNWGGQGWVNGQWRSETKNFPAQGKAGWQRPADPRDWCYYWHDVCLHNAAGIKEPKCRRKKRKQCDIDLAKCLGTIRKEYGMQYGDTTSHEIIFWRTPNDTEDVYVGGLEQYDEPESPWPTPIP